MFNNQFPIFNSGTILKKEMLENLRDYPRDFADIYYRDMSFGIISGCSINIEGYEIIVNEGILKYNGNLYSLKEKTVIPYENFSKEMILKIRFFDKETDSGFIKYGSEIFLDEDPNLYENQMELCRFKLKEGAKLRENYVDFADLSTEYNTVNILNVKYSGNGNETLHPKIIKSFGESLLKSGAKEYEDLVFAMIALNSKLVERVLILEYVNKKIGLDKKGYGNFDLYKALLRIYKNLKDGKKQEPINRNRPNVILVD